MPLPAHPWQSRHVHHPTIQPGHKPQVLEFLPRLLDASVEEDGPPCEEIRYGLLRIGGDVYRVYLTIYDENPAPNGIQAVWSRTACGWIAIDLLEGPHAEA